MRLDVYLADNGLVDSRTDAKKFIIAGSVKVNGVSVTKPAFDVDGAEEITVDKSSKKYVSRGGLKLEGALDSFGINTEGVYAIDIGASSGGFTDCLLKRGAMHVIAVDSGSGQMVESLRADPRVTVIENFNARYMSPSDFEYTPTLAVMDVSFISAKHIIPAVASILSDDGEYVCLIKPQFEVGRENIGSGGVVRNEKARLACLETLSEAAQKWGLEMKDSILSPITGGDGNTEYLALFEKQKKETKEN
jgi:23S rRNA (cytidine1920-2'-O)/16S rRNA (cytidine1409-2'-O)-methyltransferase